MIRKLIARIKLIIAEIPVEIRRFALKGGSLLAGWCLLYGLLLKPYDLVDPFLTKCTGIATVWMMQVFYHGQHPDVVYTSHAALVGINYQKVLSISDACNGLEIYVLFAGFILCVPMGAKKMMLYIIFGILGIFMLNIARCLALVSLAYNRSGFTDIAHHYIFQLAVYAAIFIIWERYFRSLKIKHETPQV